MDCFATDTASPAIALIALDAATLDRFRASASPAERRWIEAQGFAALPGTWLALPNGDGGTRAVLAGVADPADPLALAALPLTLPPGTYHLDADAGLAIDPALAVLGWGLGSYQFTRYRAAPRAPARLLLDTRDAALSDAMAQLSATVLVRDLVNTPTEDMGPDHLEAVVRALGDTHGADVSVVAGDALLDRRFFAIHAVGRASHRAPRLIELAWGAPDAPRVTLVGKGVCFDTGGLDIKPSDGMRKMKKDMGGAAHAIALAQLVMEQRLPVRLRLLVPAVENSIGPNAFRPGEVLQTHAGLTVEIDNTDAEGRLILCDALSHALGDAPDLLLDFATLTGAARIALGPDLPPLFSNDDALRGQFLEAASRARDPLWPMPLWAPYQSYLKSPIADLANSGATRMAGCITAALYLQRFVPDAQRWCHIDTYAWNDADRPGKPAGGEAQGLRAAWSLLRARYGHTA